MQILLSILTGVLFAAGVYLVLRRNLLRMIFGLILLSNAVNLLVFSMGRVARMGPPLVPEGAEAPLVAYANPLPQALVLTAIVIGFGLISFALVLVYRSFVTLGTVQADEVSQGEAAEAEALALDMNGDGHPISASPAEVKPPVASPEATTPQEITP